MRVLRTAREYRVAPSKYLRLGFKRWGETDYLLTQALALFEESMCPGGCGQHTDESMDPANEGRYERKSAVCEACAVLVPSDGAKGEPGELPYVWRNPVEPRRRQRKRAARSVER